MTNPSFCGSCGRALGSDDRFCSGCGKPIDAAPVALMKLQTPSLPPTPPDKPFDPYQPVGADNPIPADSIWATHPYPGPIPKEAYRGSVPRRLRAIGVLRGRPLEEIVSVIGLPNTMSSMPGGGTLRQWMKTSAYTGSYHYALRFDPYELCIGITHQSG